MKQYQSFSVIHQTPISIFTCDITTDRNKNTKPKPNKTKPTQVNRKYGLPLLDKGKALN